MNTNPFAVSTSVLRIYCGVECSGGESSSVLMDWLVSTMALGKQHNAVRPFLAKKIYRPQAPSFTYNQAFGSFFTHEHRGGY